MTSTHCLDSQKRQRRLAERNATTPQIAHIAGWEIDYCQTILDTYLPRRSEIAPAGIEVWEAQPNPKVVRLPDRTPVVKDAVNGSGFRKTDRKTGNGNRSDRNE